MPWDAEKYTTDFSFVAQYGSGVLELLEPDRQGTVLDLGCGTGALSGALQDRGYTVIGMDASAEMLDIAKKDHPNIPFILGDATDFHLQQPVDAVFSNAVLHWIHKDKQMDMMRCVHNALKKDGRFVFELGGYGNNRLIHRELAAVFSEHNYPYTMPFYFPTIGEYAALLESTGFQVTYAVLFDRPTQLNGENGLKDWIEMFVKAPFAVVKDSKEKEQIAAEAADRLRKDLYQDGKWYADYVRLRMKAVRL